MKDEELKAQINDIIEGEIQNGINDYLEAQEEKEKKLRVALVSLKDELGDFDVDQVIQNLL